MAFLVVLQHFIANAGPLGPIYDYFLPYGAGSLAVLVFFCLSGFVIAEAATQVYPDKPVAYLANRFLRIVPHYIVALVTAVAILAAFNTWGTLRFPELGHLDLASLHAFDWSNIAANVLGFMPGVNRFLSFDFVDVIWAVRVEMVFYFLVFLVLLVPNRERLPALVPYALATLGLATALVARQFGYGFFFLFGVLLYDHRRYPVSLPLCALGMSLHFLAFPLAKTHGLSLVVAQYSILAALIGTMTWLAFKTSNRRAFDRTCGELSYPLYLYHQNVIIVALSLTTGYSYPVFVTGVAMSLIVSYGLMRLVDPAVNRVRDIVRGRRLQPARSYAAHDSTVQWPAV